VVFHTRDGREDQDFSTALIQVVFMISAVCRPVDLPATLIRVAFSAGLSTDAPSPAVSASTGLRLELVDQRPRFVCHVE